MATNLIVPASERFEPVLMPDGWSVLDLQAEQVIEHRATWDRERAERMADALAELPAYAVLWTWSTLSACTCPIGPPTGGDLDVHTDECRRPSRWGRAGGGLVGGAR